jgi:hypothetical protein
VLSCFVQFKFCFLLFDLTIRQATFFSIPFLDPTAPPWVKGWMLGKYGKYNELKNGDDFEEWIDGFKCGVTEIGDFENWEQRFEAFIVLHPELLALSVSLAKVIAYHPWANLITVLCIRRGPLDFHRGQTRHTVFLVSQRMVDVARFFSFFCPEWA